MLALTIIGIIVLAFGISVLIVPDRLRAFSKKFDKMLLQVDEKIERYKISIGIISITTGLAVLFTVYYIKIVFRI